MAAGIRPTAIVIGIDMNYFAGFSAFLGFAEAAATDSSLSICIASSVSCREMRFNESETEVSCLVNRFMMIDPPFMGG